jgi:rubrerythrin
MLETLRSYLGGDGEVVHECRECGTAADPDAVRCPSCGATAIARYEVD